MADIRVLMVTDGGRFTFAAEPDVPNMPNQDFFGLHAIVTAMENSTTPTIQVDKAHRRGLTFKGGSTYGPDTSVGLSPAYADTDFVFTTGILAQYDVLWMIADEGFNGGSSGTVKDAAISATEQIAIATFMQNGGGVFAVGDHDGIGADMCAGLPRVRTMRRWFEWDKNPLPGVFMSNWSGGGLSMSNAQQPDRFDTLQPDSADNAFYFNDQSDPIPQTLKTKTGTPLATSAGPVHPVLRGAGGAVIAHFPDHMHEGEATDFSSVAADPNVPFNPNDSMGNPNELVFTDPSGSHPFVEFPSVGGFQPAPEVIAYGSDTGHKTFSGGAGSPEYPATAPKTRGVVSVYDGYSVGVGRIATGSTFHHYLDKNLTGDPETESKTAGAGPTGSNLGLQPPVFSTDPTQPSAISDYFVNAVTWLARPKPNFHFWTLKNTFGVDEVQDAASHVPPLNFPNAFYLALEGFMPSQVDTATVSLSGPFAETGATFAQGAAIFTGNPNTAQRVLFPFTVLSIPLGAFPLPGQGAKVLPLEAHVTAGTTLFEAEALFELVAGADPYFANVDPSVNNVFYLSQDLRILQVAPGVTPAPLVPFPSGGAGAPFTYITDLLGYLNNPSHGYTTPPPSGNDPFQILSEANAFTEDSSVAVTTLGPGGALFPNYNFAIARVRMRGGGSPATGVKVFFRMFATQSNDTDYEPQSTYLSTIDASNLPDQPLPGARGTSFPFFATSGGTGDYDPGVNDLTIPSSGSTETWRYFGCHLDVLSLPPASLPGTHHCLVAQIAYDGAPIVNSNGLTLSPENSDKLAQRNLQVTTSGNPGGPAAHRIPQTFDSRVSVRSDQSAASLLGYPDELMIDWGNTPIGSKASIYWPQVDASDVVRLATLLYATDELSAADAHTVQCVVGSHLTYVPIPFGSGENFAGLFTVDLPLGVRKGQEFHIVVRRVRTRRPEQVIDVVQSEESLRATSRKVVTSRDWRYVVGTFQVTIPVSTEDVLLWPEENKLAIMKWRLGHTAPSSRWYLVLQRYVSYLAGRVEGFGGNPATIEPSPTGVPAPATGGKGHGHPVHYTGKVCDVIFDCFGDLEAFVLETCSGRHRLVSHENGLATLLLRVCRERLILSVVMDGGPESRIRQLAVTC